MKKRILVIIRKLESNNVVGQVEVVVNDGTPAFFRQIEAWNRANDKTHGASWTHEQTRKVAFECLAMAGVEAPVGCYTTTA